MLYVLFGNENTTLRRELSTEKQSLLEKDFQLIKETAMDTFYEDLINGTDLIAFVKVMHDPSNEILFSIEKDLTNPKIYENNNWMKIISMTMVKVDCLHCDGQGFIGGHLDSYGDASQVTTYWKDQETCPSCKGSKKGIITQEAAELMGVPYVPIKEGEE